MRTRGVADPVTRRAHRSRRKTAAIRAGFRPGCQAGMSFGSLRFFTSFGGGAVIETGVSKVE
jgi:hypothetical protein